MSFSERRTAFLRILRRLWIVVLCMFVAALTASLLSGGPVTYTAEAVMIVPGGGSGEPGRAGAAQRLASTYAAVLAEDDGVTPVVASSVGRTRFEVEQGLDIVHVSGTSVVKVTYQGQTPQEAVQAVQTVVRLVTGPTPQTPTVSPGTLLPTRVASEAEPESSPPAVPIALVLGLALGVLLVITLERAEPRVDHAGDLDTVLEAPASVVRPTPEALAALAARWARRTDGYDTVAIAPLLARDAGAAVAVYRALRQHVEAPGLPGGGPVTLPSADASGARVVLETRPVTSQMDGLVPAERSTAVVLVLTQDTPVRAVRRAERMLQTMEVRVLWCLVVPRQSWRPRRGKRQVADALSEPEDRPITSVGALSSFDTMASP